VKKTSWLAQIFRGYSSWHGPDVSTKGTQIMGPEAALKNSKENRKDKVNF